MDQPVLSVEQMFNLRAFQDTVERMDRAQAQQCLVKLYEEMLKKDNVYKEMLKKQWGIEHPQTGG